MKKNKKEEPLFLYQELSPRLLIAEWHEPCNQPATKDNAIEIADKCKEKNSERLMLDMSSCYQDESSLGLQEFFDELINQLKTQHVIKIALVVPNNLFVQASIEINRIQLKKDISVLLQFFMDREKAHYWITAF